MKMPFGRYKDQDISVAVADKPYIKRLLNSKNIRVVFPELVDALETALNPSMAASPVCRCTGRHEQHDHDFLPDVPDSQHHHEDVVNSQHPAEVCGSSERCCSRRDELITATTSSLRTSASSKLPQIATLEAEWAAHYGEPFIANKDGWTEDEHRDHLKRLEWYHPKHGIHFRNIRKEMRREFPEAVYRRKPKGWQSKERPIYADILKGIKAK